MKALGSSGPVRRVPPVVVDALRILLVVGTRPEAIKMAPVVRALSAGNEFTPVVVATGQHVELVTDVLDLFGVEVDYQLPPLPKGRALSEITTSVLTGVGAAIEAETPAVVVVQGDTTSAFAGALAAYYAGVGVVHLEAGLRTGDLRSPFPEEGNRKMIGQLAALHLAPTPSAANNLLREGVDRRRVVCTGNTVIDALQQVTAQGVGFRSPALRDLASDPRRIVLATIHRRESWGEPLVRVARALRRIATSHPDVLMIVPLHPNPLVRASVRPLLEDVPNVAIVDPPAYADFARLLERSYLVITDSGGIQEEAPSLGKPVLVVRETTERPEAIFAGGVELVGTEEDLIVGEAAALLDDPEAYAAMTEAGSPYGDGRASRRTVEALSYLLDRGPLPVDFAPLGAGQPSRLVAM